MGYGLHVGWAIEGAIGSFFKIDASYLSPNVNMAAILETATKLYGVPMLISGELYDFFTGDSQSKCRQIDQVTFDGWGKPMRLYTCDVETAHLELEPPQPKLRRAEKKTMRVKARLARDQYKE